jgi:cation transport regulator ChaC
LLEQKEPKIQECRIASGRHSTLRTWVATFKSLILRCYNQFNLKAFFQTLCRAVCKVATQERGAERKPGGDSSVLDFLVLFDQAKRTKRRAERPI